MAWKTQQKTIGKKILSAYKIDKFSPDSWKLLFYNMFGLILVTTTVVFHQFLKCYNLIIVYNVYSAQACWKCLLIIMG